ncbi:hypothetical protein AVEN_241678-1 [Araneus ventricosus]|uniref:Uncharacterized protein n=1 Tax=Araneus ventricosus TaxID=182803 RepID=A0A4Y2KEG8_ARAVE|nr:hypothetical protein AVEN_241678-1 [Araneus ventricosus]
MVIKVNNRSSVERSGMEAWISNRYGYPQLHLDCWTINQSGMCAGKDGVRGSRSTLEKAWVGVTGTGGICLVRSGHECPA